MNNADETVSVQSLRAHWSENGYLVLKGFFGIEEINAFTRAVEQLVENRASSAGEITIDVLEGNYLGQRMKLRNAPDEAISAGYKLNDLYLDSDICRQLSLSQKLVSVLSVLLDGEPLIINSLNFKKGSQQPHHFDTYYMAPPVENMMVVSSICLEDQSIEAGPISYYPGSHKISAYIFSHGGPQAIDAEMDLATNYIQLELKKRGLQQEIFVGQAGDVFIWHAQLYHGGSAIADHHKTRKSLVTHYWRAGDVDNFNVGEVKGSGKYWIRDHNAAI
jgi:phytanoyl-CoA hydroxylase